MDYFVVDQGNKSVLLYFCKLLYFVDKDIKVSQIRILNAISYGFRNSKAK